MSFFKSTWIALRSVFVNGRAEDELQEEMAFHLEMQTRHNIEQGMDPVAAKKQALKTFGGAEKLKEDCRDSWGLRVLSDVLRDLNFGLRRLKKSPGFTAVAVVSLGIAIGANTAIFSMLNAILYKPLPVSNPEQLREITFEGPVPKNWLIKGRANLPDGRKAINAANHSVLLQFQESAKDHAEVVGFSDTGSIETNMRGERFTMAGMMVSGNFCEGLGVGAILGRTIRQEDDQAGAEPVALLSYKFWQNRFNGDPNVLGELITLNRSGFRVIGVLPQGFHGPRHGIEEELYVPLSTLAIVQPELNLNNERHWWIWVMARLKDGSSNEQLKASLDLAMERSVSREDFILWIPPRLPVQPNNPSERLLLVKDETDRYKNYMRSVLWDGSAGARNLGVQKARPFVFMLGAAGLVLLAACANLAGLLVARGISQQHETATRKALGAGSLRLFRQGMTESLLLAIFGAILGWIIAIGCKAAILQALGSVSQADGLGGESDYRVFLFITLLTFFAALLFGLLPALRSMKINLMDALRDRSVSRGSWLAGRVSVALQVGLALLLIVSAGLLVRSFVNIQNINPGFNMDQLLVFQLNAKNGGYEGPQLLDLYQRSMDAIRTIPGVRSVACASMPLLANNARNSGIFTIPDRPDFEGANVFGMHVSEGFFHTLEIPILSGRLFEPTDVGEAGKVVMVNESFALQFFGERNPVGRHVQFGPDYRCQVVGVCADTKYNRIQAQARPILFSYFNNQDNPWIHFQAWIHVKTDLDPLALLPAVRKAVASVDPNLPMNNVKTQAIQMDQSIFRERFQAVLLVIFASLGVFLSCIGTYGLMAYTVSHRTSEIGIRRALGADSNEAIRPILRSSLLVVGIGLVAGAVVVFSLGGLIRDQLYRVEPFDPWILGISVALLLIASVAAAWFPTRKAARMNPMDALRVE